MRGNIVMLWVLTAFFLVAAGVYTWWNYVDTGTWEVVGTVGILLSAILSGFIAFYLGAVSRTTGGVLPEDRPDAEIDDADPELGHFSPWSWWPLVLGFAVGLAFLGLAVGVWIALVGIPLIVVALVGWTYEYYRGNFGR